VQHDGFREAIVAVNAVIARWGWRFRRLRLLVQYATCYLLWLVAVTCRTRPSGHDEDECCN
jgi:hypothetical protein